VSDENCHLGQPRTDLSQAGGRGRLRDRMPFAAAVLDDLRAAFGQAEVDAVIAAGMRGEAVFHAAEAGLSIGTPLPAGLRFFHDGDRWVAA
jgi:hypothetical protein